MNLNPTYDYTALLMVKMYLNYTLLDIPSFSCEKYLLTLVLVYIRSQLAINLMEHYVTLPIFNSPTVAQLVPYDGGYFSYSSGQFWTILVMRPNLT